MPTSYPVYLYYNPYQKNKNVSYKGSEKLFDLFDIVSKKYVARNVKSITSFLMLAKSARVVVELPAGTNLTYQGGQILADKTYVVAYK